MVPVRSETVAQARPPEKGWGSRKDEALAVIAKTLLELLQQGSWQSSVYPTGWLGRVDLRRPDWGPSVLTYSLLAELEWIRPAVIKLSFSTILIGASPGGSLVKNRLPMQEMWFRSLGGEDPLGKEMTPHSSILTWKIPWTEELQSWGSQRGGHDFVTNSSCPDTAHCGLVLNLLLSESLICVSSFAESFK